MSNLIEEKIHSSNSSSHSSLDFSRLGNVETSLSLDCGIVGISSGIEYSVCSALTICVLIIQIYTNNWHGSWFRPVCKFVSPSFVLRHTSLRNNVNGGVEPWSLVTKGDQPKLRGSGGGCNPCLWISKGPRRDLRSFPTEAGDLQGRCQALMHGLTTIIFLANLIF